MAVVIGTITVTWAMVQTAIVIASISYNLYQAKKARRAAREAAEARKGFELVTEGEVISLPIVYGRGMVGGVRVYHNVSSTFKFPSITVPADKTFSTGANARDGDVYTYTDQNGTVTTSAYNGISEKKLNQNIDGNKNEFLFFQQAFCQGPINAVYDVIIEESQFIDDPALGDSTTKTIYKGGSFVEDSDPKAALRFSFFYNGGNDQIIANNFPERQTALFTNIAYLSAVIRLDRDEPQFDRIPNIQALIEGRKVKVINRTGTSGNYTYSLASSLTYSNNPAYCLLDYLLDSTSGKALLLAQIDLKSFYDAAQVCDITIQNNVNVGGKIWQPTDNSRNVSTRNLPLYECNIVIDTSKPVRENVEAILATMGDARLIWSQGSYKLSLQYPLTNSSINLATTLTDDDLVHDKAVEVGWPSSSQRLNSCTIRFHNEANNFKEDSVSWPPKTNQQYTRGIGAKRYNPVSGWEANSEGHKLLNNYAVWDGGTTSTSMTWRIIPKISGIYTLQLTADNSATLTLAGSSTGASDHNAVVSSTRALNANQEYILTITGSDDNNGGRGVAAILTAPDGTTLWTTRSESYSSFVNVTQTNTIYNAMLAEDNSIILETDLFAEGITDYYHALAKAEEMVRVSRSAIVVRFQYILKDKYLEPGDIIKLNSTTLNLGNTADLFLRVDEVRLMEGSICEVSATRFDYTQLAWSVKPAESVVSPNLYNFYLTAPSYVTFTSGNNIINNSPGTLTWGLSPETSISGYIIYFHEFQNLDSGGRPIFVEIGRATAPPFYVPDLGSVIGVFGVRAFTNTITSEIAVTSTTQVTKIDALLNPPTATSLNAALFGDFDQAIKLNWTIPSIRSNGINYEDHGLTRIYRAKNIENPSFIEIGTSANNEFIDNTNEFGDLLYKVRLESTRKLLGSFSNTAAVNLPADNALASDRATVFAYKRSLDPLSSNDNPGSATYSFATNQITSTLANNWSKVIPSGDDTLYVVVAIVSSTASTVTFPASAWSSPSIFVKTGQDAVTIDLLSEADVTRAEQDGTNYSLPPNNAIRLYKGGELLTSNVVYSGTITKNGLTATVNSSTGQVTFTGSAWTTNTESFIFQAVYGGNTYSVLYTYAKSKDGDDAIIPDLKSESEIAFANVNGVVSTLPSGNEFRLYKGGTILNSGLNFFVGSSGTQSQTKNGLTLTINATTGAFSLTQSSWSSDFEQFTLSCIYDSITYSKIYSLTKQRVGATGAAAALFTIDNAAAIFKKDRNDLITPETITLVTTAINVSAIDGYKWYKNDTEISGATSSTYSVPKADFNATTSNTYKCILTGTINGITNSTLQDFIVIPRLDDGTETPTVVISNNAVQFQGPTTGYDGITFTSAHQVVVNAYIGTTQLSYGTSGAYTFSVTKANTGITVATGTGSGVDYVIPQPSGISSDTAYVDITITIRGLGGTVAATLTRRILYVISRAGYDTIFLDLTNDIHTIPADELGVALSYNGATTTMSIIRAGLDESNLWTIDSSASTGITYSKSNSNRTATVTAVTNNFESGVITFTATRTGFTTRSVDFTITKLKGGKDTIVTDLSNDSHIFPSSSAGVVSTYLGGSTNLTLYKGGINDTANWTIATAVSNPNILINGANSASVEIISFPDNLDSGYIDFTASRSGFSTQSARFSFIKGKQGFKGEPAVTLALSNEVHSIPANAGGIPISYSGASSTATILFAGVDDSSNWTFDSTASAGITYSKSNSNRTATILVIENTFTAGYIDFTATRAGYTTQTSRFIVNKLNAGKDTVIVNLTNDSHPLPADLNGVVTSYTGASSTISIFVGDVDDTANWTISITSSTGVTASLSGATATVSAIVDNVDSGYVDFTVSKTNYPTRVLRFSLAKARQGAVGTAAIFLDLSNNSHEIPANANGDALSYVGAASTATILSGGVDDSANWSFDAVASVGITIEKSNSNRTATVTAVTNAFLSGTVTFTATRSGYSNRISIFSLSKLLQGEDGDSAVSIQLSNDSHPLPALNTGVVSSYVGASCTATIDVSGIDESATWTFTNGASDPNITYTSSNANRTVTVTAFPSNIDAGYIDFTASKTGYTSKIARFSLVKVKDGANGTNGTDGLSGYNNAIVYAYKRSTSAPTDNPGAITYTFASASITVPDTLANSWSKTVPTGTDPLYVVVASASDTGATDNIAATEWSSPVLLVQNGSNGTNGTNGTNGSNGTNGTNGIDGYNVATVFLYQRNNDAGSAPSVRAGDTTTYTFSTGSVSNQPTNWSGTIPAASNGTVIWVIQATASARATTDSIADSEWSSPRVLTLKGDNGTNGTNGTNGSAGATAVTAYKLVYSATGLPSSPAVGSGAPTSGTATQDTSNSDVNWYTQPPASIAANYWLFQKSGTLLVSTYTWISPSFLATFKVGQLSALSADIGTITAGQLTSGTASDGVIVTPKGMKVVVGGVVRVRIGDLSAW